MKVISNGRMFNEARYNAKVKANKKTEAKRKLLSSGSFTLFIAVTLSMIVSYSIITFTPAQDYANSLIENYRHEKTADVEPSISKGASAVIPNIVNE